MAQGPISAGCRGEVAGDARAASSETCRCVALWASTSGRGRLPEALLQMLPLWEPWQEVEACEGPKRACPRGLQRKLLGTFLIPVACCSQGRMAGPLHRARRAGQVGSSICAGRLICETVLELPLAARHSQLPARAAWGQSWLAASTKDARAWHPAAVLPAVGRPCLLEGVGPKGWLCYGTGSAATLKSVVSCMAMAGQQSARQGSMLVRLAASWPSLQSMCAEHVPLCLPMMQPPAPEHTGWYPAPGGQSPPGRQVPRGCPKPPRGIPHPLHPGTIQPHTPTPAGELD